MPNDSSKEFNRIIAIKRFTVKDQIKFAKLSGDYNPIHLDAIAARRTISGQCVVHGMHSLLWALDSLAKENGVTASKIVVKFLKPMFLEEEIICIWNDRNQSISLMSDGIALSTIKIKIGKLEKNNFQINIQTPLNQPLEPSFSECSKLFNQSFKVFSDEELSKKLFPSFVSSYGSIVLIEIAAISQIVGMECPGLNSLFGSLHVQIGLNQNSTQSFTVARADDRFNLLEIHVEGRTISAEVTAFFISPPETEYHVSELATYIKHNEFKNVTALICGGSRGLGALVAKLIAAGGGKPTITYNVGELDAEKLVNEIHSWGGYCKAMQFTIKKLTSLPDGCPDFNQFYYFATPKILSKRSPSFDKKISTAYREVYVSSFNDLCNEIINRKSKCSILYPSTIWINNPPPQFENYIEAKMAGEKLCETLNKENSILKIITPRLPRIKTDQTQTLIKENFTNSIEIMLPLLREMTN